MASLIHQTLRFSRNLRVFAVRGESHTCLCDFQISSLSRYPLPNGEGLGVGFALSFANTVLCDFWCVFAAASHAMQRRHDALCEKQCAIGSRRVGEVQIELRCPALHDLCQRVEHLRRRAGDAVVI